MHLSVIEVFAALLFTGFAMFVALPSSLLIENLKIKNNKNYIFKNFYRNLIQNLRQDKVLLLTIHLQLLWGLILIAAAIYTDNKVLLLISSAIISFMPIIKDIIDREQYLKDIDLEDKVLICIWSMFNICILSQVINIYSLILVVFTNLHCLNIINSDIRPGQWDIKLTSNITSKTGYYLCLLAQLLLLAKSSLLGHGTFELICVTLALFLIILNVLNLVSIKSIIRRMTRVTERKRLILMVSILYLMIIYNTWRNLK